MIHLALVFPKARAVTVTWPWIVGLPYIPSLVIVGLRHLTSTAYWNMPKSVLLSWLGYTLIGVVFFLISTGWNCLRDPSIVTRLQSRVMVIGILLGFLIPSFDLLSGLLWRVSLFPDPIVGFGVCFSLFPLSIAYTIVKHDLFAIDVIVRRTYGYVLSTGTVVAAYAAVVSLLNITFRGSDVARSPLFSIAFALGVVFMFEPLHRRIQRLVDRTFYRQQYDYRTTIRGLSEAMTSILDPVVIRKTLVDAVVREMFLESGVLLLRRDEARAYTVEIASGVTAESIAAVPSDDALMDLIRERKTHVLRHDVELNPSLRQRRTDVLRTFGALASELVLPVTYKDEVRGLLSLGRKKSGKLFTPEDLDLLRTVVNQSAIALENARLFTENLAKGRMEEELKIAHDIQMGMLPDAPPRLKGLQLAARTIPAREVGGDFYDFVSLPPDGGERLGIVIGDVSGKGVSAGLLMAGARSTYRVLVDASASAQEVMILANRRLQRDVRRGMFVALLYAVFERDGRAVTVVNAGQTQPILVQRGAPPEFVVSEGDTFPLGIVADCDYRESTMKLTDGSLVVFYTDGIVEAMNTSGELYGFDRFIESVAEGRELTAPALLDKLVADVVRFTGAAEQHDDITMIVARVE
jgi:serine phosphatase RsbU (regulator of sigma subunit)